MTDSLIPPNTGKTLTMKAFKTAEALAAQFRQHAVDARQLRDKITFLWEHIQF
jgi:hypothetical protein